MTVDFHKVVVLTYELTVDGQKIDEASPAEPLDYIQGCHMLIPGFEDALEGRSEGEAFEFSVAPEDAYGEYDPLSRFDIPKNTFEVDGTLREDLLVPGRVIPMFNSEGRLCHATIIEVKDDSVTVDFNHPLAGKTLVFTGQILSVREATKKELDEGLHGEFLPQEGCCHHHGEGECHGEGGCSGHCSGEDGECHCSKEGDGGCDCSSQGDCCHKDN